MSTGNKSSDRLIDVLKQIQARKSVKPEDATKALQQYLKVQEHIKALKAEIEMFKANKERERAAQGQPSQASGNVSRKGSITTRSRSSGIQQQTPLRKTLSQTSVTPRILNGPTEDVDNIVSKLQAKVDADKPMEKSRAVGTNKAQFAGTPNGSKGAASQKDGSKVNANESNRSNGEDIQADNVKELARLRFQNAQMRVTLNRRRSSTTTTTTQDTEPAKGFVVPLKAFPVPEKLVEEFKRIHDMEWRSAFHDLDKHYKMKEDNITELLGAIAKEAYNFCLVSERQQFEDIKKSLVYVTDVLVQPKYAPQTRDVIIAKSKSIIDKDGFQVTRRFLREYRRAMARVPIPGLTEIFEQIVQKDIISKHTTLRITPKSTRPFIQKLIEVNWLMALQEPHMTQVWPRGGQLMNREWFGAYSKKGATIIHTVWPALFIHKEGTLAEKGVCLVK